MRIFYPCTENLPCGAVIALGNFDGVHLGHRELLRRGAALAASQGSEFGIWTLQGSLNRCVIMPESEKLRLFEQLGADFVILEAFNDIRAMTPEEFVDDKLIGTYHISGAVCGFNFHFGHDAAGDAALLTQLLGAHGVPVVTVPPVTLDGELVSSTAIRRFITEGEMTAAAAMLTQPYSITGVVCHGSRLGRELGFPTINQMPEEGRLLPRFGVYESRTYADGAMYRSVSNIGLRPTVDGENVTLETFILGYGGELYDEAVTVELIKFIRGEICFDSVEKLKLAVLADIEKVKGAEV